MLRIGILLRVGITFGVSKQVIFKYLALSGILLYETETLNPSLKCPIGTFLLKKIFEILIFYA